jgi:PhnB protein
MSLPGVPKGMNSVCPYLLVADGVREVEFIKSAFGGKLEYRLDGSGGSLMHAQMRVNDSIVMVGQAGTSNQSVHVYVADVDATYERALAAGATSVRAVEDQFYGDRSGGVSDSNGVIWWIATHVRDVSEDEAQRLAGQKQR